MSSVENYFKQEGLEGSSFIEVSPYFLKDKKVSILRLSGFVYQPLRVFEEFTEEGELFPFHLSSAIAGYLDAHFYKGEKKKKENDFSHSSVELVDRRGHLQIRPYFSADDNLKIWRVHAHLYYPGSDDDDDKKRPFTIKINDEGEPAVLKMKVEQGMLFSEVEEEEDEKDEEDEEGELFITGYFTIQDTVDDMAQHEIEMALNSLMPDCDCSFY